MHINSSMLYKYLSPRQIHLAKDNQTFIFFYYRYICMHVGNKNMLLYTYFKGCSIAIKKEGFSRKFRRNLNLFSLLKCYWRWWSECELFITQNCQNLTVNTWGDIYSKQIVLGCSDFSMTLPRIIFLNSKLPMMLNLV